MTPDPTHDPADTPAELSDEQLESAAGGVTDNCIPTQGDDDTKDDPFGGFGGGSGGGGGAGGSW